MSYHILFHLILSNHFVSYLISCHVILSFPIPSYPLLSNSLPAPHSLPLVILFVSDPEEQLQQAQVQLSGHIQGVELPVCPGPVQPAGLHLGPAEAGRQAGRPPLRHLLSHQPADATREWLRVCRQLLPPGAGSLASL